ncbi:MAG TPA: aspartate aminotransferase family protein [Candidatus Binatia bacterium]|nr:aspartate aminotransferase family protein [Candidatus Binatia bacterium]
MPPKERVSLVKTSLPGPKSKLLIQKESQTMAAGAYGDPADRRFMAIKAQGSLIEDVDGNRFIDFGSGWGTNNVGNCHPEVVEAVTATMRQLGVTCWTSAGNTAQRLELAEKLLAVCPKSNDRVLFLTTGTEAVEAALRVMRRASGRQFVLSFYGQYHGLSYGCMAAGPLEAHVREDVAPLVNGFVYAPYPYSYRTPLQSRTGGGPGRATLEYIEDMILTYEVPPERIAGVLVEPVVGEAGVWVPPDDFLPGLRALCDKHDWYLCIDEVQSGFGRCGKMWAFEHWNVDPDLIVVGKGLSGGSMPIAAVTGRHEIFDAAQAFVAGTYAGHPAACAAGVKTLEIIARDRVLEHATELGAYGMKRLQAMKEKFPIIGEVRGMGLWLTAEFIKDPKTREKNFEAAALVNEHCLKNGLYYIHDSISWFVRIQPPLTIERPLFEQGMDILEEAIAAANAAR